MSQIVEVSRERERMAENPTPLKTLLKEATKKRSSYAVFYSYLVESRAEEGREGNRSRLGKE